MKKIKKLIKRLMKAIKDEFIYPGDDIADLVSSRPVTGIEVPMASQAVFDHIAEVRRAFTSPITLETKHNAVLWDAGARAALDNLVAKLERNR